MKEENYAHGNSSERKTFSWARLVFWLGIALVSLTTGLAIWMHVYAVEGDFQNANLATFASCGFAFLTLMWWFIAISGLPRLISFLPLVGTVCGLSIFFYFNRIGYVSGDLVPTFAPRWEKTADEKLEVASIGVAEEGVDLVTTSDADFPQFLGPQRNSYLPDVQLARDWDTTPPRELWRQPIGAAWSGFAAVNGYAITFEQRGADELVTCYRVTTGDLVWSHAVAVRHKTILGGIGPRSTVTIDDGRVYAVGATGIVRCLAGESGELLWQVDLPTQFGSDPQQDLALIAWGRASSPLVLPDKVVIPAGGRSNSPTSLVALDKATGKEIWRGGQRQISYASPTLVTLQGRQQILIVNEAHVSGFDVESGQGLWEYPWPGQSNGMANVSQAHVIDENYVLLSKGYGGGGALIQVKGSGDPELIWGDRKLLKTKFTNGCIINDHIYALSDGILECVEVMSGKRKWKRGRYRHGQILGVGDTILVQAEDGRISLVAASTTGYQELGSIQALSSKTWNNLCLHGRYLLARNDVEAVCYEIALRETP